MGLNAGESGNVIFATILSEDASIRVKAVENAPNAERREWTMGTKSGVKWEYKYADLTGKITKVFVKENKFDTSTVKVLNIHVLDNDKTISLQTPLSSNFASDFLKRLPNVDFSENVKLIPYNLMTENGKTRKGIAIHQGPEKRANYFYDPKTKANLFGFAEVDETDRYEDWYWKSYFGKVTSFLAKFLEDKITSKIEQNSNHQYEPMNEAEINKSFNQEHPNDLPDNINSEDVSSDDLPF